MTEAPATATRQHRLEDGTRVTVEEAVVYVIEISDELAKATGLDLNSSVAATVDSVAAVKVVQQLGMKGSAYISTRNGTKYLILRGYPGKRPHLPGTRYLKSNPKVAHITTGAKDFLRAAGRITGIALVAYTGLRIAQELMVHDEVNLARLFGTVASDLAKFAASAGAGALAGIALGAVVTGIAGPMIFAITVSIGVSIVLDRVDRHFGITDSLIAELESYAQSFESIFDRMAREISAWERHLINQAVSNTMRR